MSVIDSEQDLAAAQERLKVATPRELDVDLRFWSVACLDASADYIAAQETEAAARVRYHEAQQWTTLIAKELRSRRDARVGNQAPTEQ